MNVMLSRLFLILNYRKFINIGLYSMVVLLTRQIVGGRGRTDFIARLLNVIKILGAHV